VRAAVDAGITVTPIPGASALLAALVASGLALERFTFFGFLTRSGSERREALDEISSLAHTAVLYEAPSRVAATLNELERRGNGDRQCVVAREMTKQFEEVRRGTVSGLRAYYEQAPPRGEIVLLIGPANVVEADEKTIRARVEDLRSHGMSSRDIAAQVARELNVPKRVAYRMTQESNAVSTEESGE
jgi:16S rRNA (cytidine1402-2'-O)-methyltransferase